MKVVLLENVYPYYKLDSTSDLTIGKIYDAINISDGASYYIIKNDYGFVKYYKKTFFKPLSDHREEKINLLLNNQ